MEDYLCVTVLAELGESEADFKSRLTEFWSHMLRTNETTFEKVYAETAQFEIHDGRLTRKYLFELAAIESLEQEFREQGIQFEPVDEGELYSKYEATPPDWFWIEH